MVLHPITSFKSKEINSLKHLLARAIKNQNRRNFELYIKAAEPDELTEPMGNSGFSVLHLAAKSNDPYFIHHILDLFPNIDLTKGPMPLKNGIRKEGNGETVFHMVSKGDGSASVLKRLLEIYPQGALIPDKYGSTALHKAIKSAKKTALLLNHVNALPINSLGSTPLHTGVTAYLRQQDMSWRSNILPVIFYLYVKKFGGVVLALENQKFQTPLNTHIEKPKISPEYWKVMREWILAVALKAELSHKISDSDILKAKKIAEEKRPLEFKVSAAA